MLQLSLQSGECAGGRATMYIDYQDESVGFTVLTEGKQFDFCIEKEEWERFKGFIETAMEKELIDKNEIGKMRELWDNSL